MMWNRCNPLAQASLAVCILLFISGLAIAQESDSELTRQEAVAWMYGINRPIDYAAAERLLREAYRQGDLLAGVQLYQMLISRYDFRETREETKSLAAQFQDPLLALVKSQTGNWEAEFLYTAAYMGLQDNPEFDAYINKVSSQLAAAGYLPAMMQRGAMCSNGLHIEKDLEQAAYWFKRSMDQGSVAAMTAYAGILRNEDFSGCNFVQAAELFRQAAENGSAIAWENIGYMYENGIYLERDPQLALWCYDNAIRIGSFHARFSRARLLTDITCSQADMLEAKQQLIILQTELSNYRDVAIFYKDDELENEIAGLLKELYLCGH